MRVLERKRILEEELKRIVGILIKEYLPEKIILFGSLAKDYIHEWSDIDLLIIKDTQKRFLDRIEEVLFLVSPNVGVNVIVYTPKEFDYILKQKDTFLKEEILEKGKVIYESEKHLG